MRIHFLEPAQYELDDAYVWYEQQMTGLGRELLDEVDRSIRRMAQWPSAGIEVGAGLRRCLVKRFPYGIIYGVEEDVMVVVSFGHLHRKPFYWIDRWGKTKET